MLIGRWARSRRAQKSGVQNAVDSDRPDVGRDAGDGMAAGRLASEKEPTQEELLEQAVEYGRLSQEKIARRFAERMISEPDGVAWKHWAYRLAVVVLGTKDAGDRVHLESYMDMSKVWVFPGLLNVAAADRAEALAEIERNAKLVSQIERLREFKGDTLSWIDEYETDERRATFLGLWEEIDGA